MQTITQLSKNKTNIGHQPSSCTVGNFDGLHLGHQKLIKEAIDYARSHASLSLALSFDPPPELFFNKNLKLERLFTLDQKLRAFAELGLDVAVIEAFDEDFSTIAAEDFVKNYLLGQLNLKRLCIGQNFHFGFKRRGHIALLETMSADHSFGLKICEPISMDGADISSSRVRTAVSRGDMISVARMLGRPYLIEGHVTKGDQLGRTIGFPTLNLALGSQLAPGSGVYLGYVYLPENPDDHATVMQVSAEAKPAVFNIGVRPSVSKGSELRIEAHLITSDLPFDGIYGHAVGFYFVDKIRDEKKFASLEELKAAISSDVAFAKTQLKAKL